MFRLALIPDCQTCVMQCSTVHVYNELQECSCLFVVHSTAVRTADKHQSLENSQTCYIGIYSRHWHALHTELVLQGSVWIIPMHCSYKIAHFQFSKWFGSFRTFYSNDKSAHKKHPVGHYLQVWIWQAVRWLGHLELAHSCVLLQRGYEAYSIICLELADLAVRMSDMQAWS